MDITRIRHVKELDRKDLFMPDYDFPSPDHVIEHLGAYVESIHPSDENSVLLSSFFTNHYRETWSGRVSKRSYEGSIKHPVLTVCIFPTYGAVSYELKNRAFWVNQGSEHQPVQIRTSIQAESEEELLTEEKEGCLTTDINLWFLFKGDPFKLQDQNQLWSLWRFLSKELAEKWRRENYGVILDWIKEHNI